MSLPNPHAVCVTTDLSLRRVLRRTLQAVGSTVEFCDKLAPGGADTSDLVFIDRDARLDGQSVTDLAAAGKIVMLGDSLEDDDVVAVLRNERLDHIIADAANPDELELFVTSVKLLSGDIFGLEKYLAWGADVRELEVSSYEGKRLALLQITEHAASVGVRRAAVARIESVTDELLMNAMYDAPAIRSGDSPRLRAGAGNSEGVAVLRYACDGRYFAVSVQDDYGELHKEAILDHVLRARAERGRPRSSDELEGGAGLGLYFILSSVTRFIANIRPGHLTEVVCLFDLRQTGRQTDNCARSLHVFVAGEVETVDGDYSSESAA